MKDQDIVLITKYVAKELKGEELARFEQRLQNEPELQKIVFSEQFIDWSLRPHPLSKAKQIVAALGEDLWTEEEKKNLDSLSPYEPTYTLEQLTEQFKPIVYLEEEVVSRSTDEASQNRIESLILLPEKGIDCKKGQLIFDFEEELPFPLELTLLDNKENELSTQIVPAQVYYYSVDVSNLPPGRYYWWFRAGVKDRQLKRKTGDALGWFFIKKDLMP